MTRTLLSFFWFLLLAGCSGPALQMSGATANNNSTTVPSGGSSTNKTGAGTSGVTGGTPTSSTTATLCYPQTVLTPTATNSVNAILPAAYWRLNDYSTKPTAADSSGYTNSNNGTYGSGIADSTLSPLVAVAGITNASALFSNATSSIIGFSNALNSNFNASSTAATVEFWMLWGGPNGTNGSTSSNEMPFTFGSGTGNAYDFTVHTNNNGTYLAFNATNNTYYGVAYTPSTTTWVHIAAVFQNGASGTNQNPVTVANNLIYVNGQLMLSPTIAAAANPTANTILGSSNFSGSLSSNIQISGWRGVTGSGSNYTGSNDNFFIGNLAEVALYNGALSADEIALHYSAANIPCVAP